jgi:hypothetical protein
MKLCGSQASVLSVLQAKGKSMPVLPVRSNPRDGYQHVYSWQRLAGERFCARSRCVAEEPVAAEPSPSL